MVDECFALFLHLGMSLHFLVESGFVVDLPEGLVSQESRPIPHCCGQAGGTFRLFLCGMHFLQDVWGQYWVVVVGCV